MDLEGNAVCRPRECLTAQPPLCGSPEATCGATCPQPDCAGRECGEDPRFGISCGSCGPHRYCIDEKCRQEPGYALCEGDLQATPPEVPVEQAQGTIPPPQGGQIVDGIYDLVAQREYVGPGISETYTRAALRFTSNGTRVEHIYDAGTADAESPHRLMSVSISSVTLAFEISCPDRNHVFWSEYSRDFDAQGEEIWLHQERLLEIYTRRPEP